MIQPATQPLPISDPTADLHAGKIKIAARSLLRSITAKSINTGESTDNSDNIDPVHFMLAGADGELKKQNSKSNPYPLQIRGKLLRQHRPINQKDVGAHLATVQSLHVQSDATANIWDLAVEIDNKQTDPTQYDAAMASYASGDFLDQVESIYPELTGYHYDRSRGGCGMYGRFQVDRSNYSPVQAVAIIKLLAEVIRRQFPKTESGPQFDEIKGLPALALPNPDFCESSANETSYEPYPRDREQWDRQTLYGSHTALDRYKHAKQTYTRGQWNPDRDTINHLEQLVTTQGSTIPAPCNYYRFCDVSPEAITKRVAEYIAHRHTAKPTPLVKIAKRIGIKSTKKLNKAIARHTAVGKVDWAGLIGQLLDGTKKLKVKRSSANGDTDRMAGIHEMIASSDVLTRSNGIAFLTLHQTGGQQDIELALLLYSQLVPVKGSEDADRRNRLKCCLAFAAREFDPAKRSGQGKGIRARIDKKVELLTTRLQALVTVDYLADYNQRHITIDSVGNEYWKPETYLNHHTLAHLAEAAEALFVRTTLIATEKLSEHMAKAGHTMDGKAIRAGMTLLARLGVIECVSSKYHFTRGQHTGYCRQFDFQYDQTKYELKPVNGFIPTVQTIESYSLGNSLPEIAARWLMKYKANAKNESVKAQKQINRFMDTRYSLAEIDNLISGNDLLVSPFIIQKRLLESEAKTVNTLPLTLSFGTARPAPTDPDDPDEWWLG